MNLTCILDPVSFAGSKRKQNQLLTLCLPVGAGDFHRAFISRGMQEVPRDQPLIHGFRECVEVGKPPAKQTLETFDGNSPD